MKSRSNDWLKVARPFLVVFVCSFVLPISGIAADLPQSEPVIKDKYDCELIFVGQCLGAKLSSNVSETQPPVARFNPYRILKGPPLPTYYNVRYDFWSGLKPDNFDYSQITQSLMPSLNSLWILYIPIAVPSSDGKSETSLKTYRGAEGREELTLANFDKFVAWRNVWLRSHNLDVIDRDLEYWQLISAAYSHNPELFVQQDVVLRGRFGVRSNANPVLYTDAGPPVELFNANLRAIPDGSKLQVVGKLNYAEPDTAVVSSLGVAPGHYYFNAAGSIVTVLPGEDNKVRLKCFGRQALGTAISWTPRNSSQARHDEEQRTLKYWLESNSTVMNSRSGEVFNGSPVTVSIKFENESDIGTVRLLSGSTPARRMTLDLLRRLLPLPSPPNGLPHQKGLLVRFDTRKITLKIAADD